MVTFFLEREHNIYKGLFPIEFMGNEHIHDEKIDVAESMEKYGGSFIKALGKALLQADILNTIKIKNTWPNEWEKYKELK